MSYPPPFDRSQSPNSGAPGWQGQPQPPAQFPVQPSYPTPYDPPSPMYQAIPAYGQPADGVRMYGGPGFAADPGAPFGRDAFTGEPLSDKSKVAAGLLQLFLGGFGVGRFYIGSNGIAAAQLCTLIVGWLLALVLIGYLILLGLMVWVIVDAIMIFTGGVRDSRGLKLRN